MSSPAGIDGVFNLRPARSSRWISMATAEGRPGPIEIRARRGFRRVTADPVTIKFLGRLGGPGRPARPGGRPGRPEGVARFANPGLSEIPAGRDRKPPGVNPITHAAEAVIGLDPTNLAGCSAGDQDDRTRFPFGSGGTPTGIRRPNGPTSAQPIQVPGARAPGVHPEPVPAIRPVPVGRPRKGPAQGGGEGCWPGNLHGRLDGRKSFRGRGQQRIPQFRALASTKAPRWTWVGRRRGPTDQGPPPDGRSPVRVRVPVEVIPPTVPASDRAWEEIGIQVRIKRQPGCEAEVGAPGGETPPVGSSRGGGDDRAGDGFGDGPCSRCRPPQHRCRRTQPSRWTVAQSPAPGSCRFGDSTDPSAELLPMKRENPDRIICPVPTSSQ